MGNKYTQMTERDGWHCYLNQMARWGDMPFYTPVRLPNNEAGDVILKVHLVSVGDRNARKIYRVGQPK